MIKAELDRMYVLDGFLENTVKALTGVVSETIQEVHKTAVAQAAVDTGRMRNTIRWSLNGGKSYGGNSEPITTPSILYSHKDKARPLGEKADKALPSDFMKFPRNRSKYIVTGYVGSSAKTSKRGFPYALYQELGTMRTPAQPYLFQNLERYAHTRVLTPRFYDALSRVDGGMYKRVPLNKDKVKKTGD